ncbi:MAG: Smr/MutS family protein [Hydrogenovibrio sp.]|nr:Smr/MutS family protein [Hydrogenovibrio sp.]
MSEISEEDKLLFAEAMKGTQPLELEKRANLHPPSSPPKNKRHYAQKTFSLDDDRDSFAFDAEFIPAQTVSAHETLFYQRTELRKQDLKTLKKGLFGIEWRLDLHGYTADLAEQELNRFIQSAYQSGVRYALVIHGKGYNSDTQSPTLKNMVNQSLRQMSPVLAFCSAQPKDGGQGATYVFIKQNAAM